MPRRKISGQDANGLVLLKNYTGLCRKFKSSSKTHKSLIEIYLTKINTIHYT